MTEAKKETGFGPLISLAGLLAFLAGGLSLPLHLFLWLKSGEKVWMDVVSVAHYFGWGGWWTDPQSWFGLWKFLRWLHIAPFLGVAGALLMVTGLIVAVRED